MRPRNKVMTIYADCTADAVVAIEAEVQLSRAWSLHGDMLQPSLFLLRVVAFAGWHAAQRT